MASPGMDADARLVEAREDGNRQPGNGQAGSAGFTVAGETMAIPGVLAIVPMRRLVLFPGTYVPIPIRRESSRKAVEESLPQNKIIGIFTQRSPDEEKPGPQDLYPVGCAAAVLKLVRQPDETMVILVQALQRIALGRVVSTEPYLKAETRPLESIPAPADDRATEAAVRSLRETAARLIELSTDEPDAARLTLLNVEDPGRLSDVIAGSLNLGPEEKQPLLEELDVARRVRAVHIHVSRQLEIAQLQEKIKSDVASNFTDAQRRAYLREQVRAIQKELGEDEGTEQQVEELRRRLREAAPPEAVLEQGERDLRRLERIHPASPEFSVIVSHLEVLAELPWSKLSEDNFDLGRAQSILDRDHFDLEKVKRRLIEYLAVRKLNPEGRGPILCLAGPPGVGKTSLGTSIADALGRKFIRVSLGGVRDEAEIRGHRRTYVGAMPGRIIQELRRCGTRNPVMMLDEIDKLGADFRGDPASALLEVLDPRQNHAFVDHYLDVPFDLSQILFIATANYLDPVPAALRDRMEVIDIPGYTDQEKLQIARRYIVDRQLKENGLKPEQCRLADETLNRVIREYTREAGVRDLERRIGAICRSVAARVAKGEVAEVTVTPEMAQEILGPARRLGARRLKTGRPGVVTGLAWTPAGGEILQIEALRYPGRGELLLTGHIGDVMKESARAALSLVKSRAKELGIDPAAFKDVDVHIHVPEGAVPKDGPSAGVAMFTALASLFSDRPVRADLGMTGEITLRGLVLPIGGLKEKTLAALREGLEIVVAPKLNEKDLVDVPAEAKEKLKIVTADTVDEVLELALEK